MTLPHKLSFIISAILLTACDAFDTIVDVEIPKEPPRLVANAFLQADSAVVLELTQSQSILSNATLREIAGATATLLEDGQQVAMLEGADTPGLYYSIFTPSVGKNYTLQVSKAGFESIEATTFIHPPVAIQEIEVDTTLLINSYMSEDSIITERNIVVNEARVTFNDPANESNYYELLAYRYVSQFIGDYDDQGNYIVTDTLRYLEQLYLSSDDPAVAEGESDVLEGDSDFYGAVLSFSDDFFNGKPYTLRFKLDAYYYEYQADPQLYIMLRSINEGQYRYFRSVDLQYENEGNPFAEPVQVYSNVSNGYGIVSGSSADQVVIDLE